MNDPAYIYRRWWLGTGFGVEGKIKAGVPPWQLTPCLHIHFGVPPLSPGESPHFARSPATIEDWGGTPFANPNKYGGL